MGNRGSRPNIGSQPRWGADLCHLCFQNIQGTSFEKTCMRSSVLEQPTGDHVSPEFAANKCFGMPSLSATVIAAAMGPHPAVPLITQADEPQSA